MRACDVKSQGLVKQSVCEGCVKSVQLRVNTEGVCVHVGYEEGCVHVSACGGVVCEIFTCGVCVRERVHVG